MWQISWILGLLPEWFWTLLLIAGVLGTLAAWVLKFIPFISNYRLPIQVASILMLVAGVYYEGFYANEAKWKAEIAEMEKKVIEAQAQATLANKTIESKVEVQTKVVREKGKDIIKYVDREVVKKEEIIKYIEQCPVPKEIIDLHNQAAEMNKAARGNK